jgi:hypothetical protein
MTVEMRDRAVTRDDTTHVPGINARRRIPQWAIEDVAHQVVAPQVPPLPELTVA